MYTASVDYRYLLLDIESMKNATTIYWYSNIHVTPPTLMNFQIERVSMSSISMITLASGSDAAAFDVFAVVLS